MIGRLTSRGIAAAALGICAIGITLTSALPVRADSDPSKDTSTPPIAVPDDIVFVVRPYGPDPHYYANFGYYSYDPQQKVYPLGGKLCRLDVQTGQVTVLLDGSTGGVRDPQLHYDAEKILFSYRPAGTEHFHLYEIGVDGSGLKQLTSGPFDDIEPTYLPDDSIVFCSSRCDRWVACWKVPVAILYHCDSDGQQIRMLSSNAVTENTPAVLPDGRLLYTRWEYNDRSQLCYHHLWTINPDGTGQMTFFGNMYPTGKPHNIRDRAGNVVSYDNVPGAVAMLDAKPVPGSRQVVAIFSPGHGRPEHEGFVTLIDPRKGPDHQPSARRVHAKFGWRDPYPISEDEFLVAHQRELHLMTAAGETTLLHRLSDPDPAMKLHEPILIRRRDREKSVSQRNDRSDTTSRLVLADVTRGRNMAGVEPGEITQLLVLEQLPAPFHDSPGFDGISIWGPFTIARILGTVPVEPDGSAYMEVPALRSLFFVALDSENLAVKKMQSFVTTQPGEVTSCVGCHEPRHLAPDHPDQGTLMAVRRAPSQIQPIANMPRIVDFRRHIQPLLDTYCIECHGQDDPDGNISLAATHSVPAHGRGRVLAPYVALTHRLGEVVDGRNAHGNRAPRKIGSSASRFLTRFDGSHYDVQAAPDEMMLIRLWLDSGAVANGTYAIMDGGTPDQPSWQYIREMKKYGILDRNFNPDEDPLDVYQTDDAYWRSFWYEPK